MVLVWRSFLMEHSARTRVRAGVELTHCQHRSSQDPTLWPRREISSFWSMTMSSIERYVFMRGRKLTTRCIVSLADS